jgi:mRNA-degrading endonuclease toxin of MazEF toxin-antitoxin module
VKCEQILTLSKSRLLQSRPIGRVTPEQLSQIEIGLKRSLQLL